MKQDNNTKSKSELSAEQRKTKRNRNRITYILIAFAAGLSSIAELAVQYFLKDELKLEPATMSQIFSIIYSPWMIKPLFGFLTDMFPICGYRRKIYILIVSMLIMFCWLTLSGHTKTLTEATILLFLINCGLSFSTVLGEAIVVELSQLEEDKDKVNEKAKNYVSLFFATKYTGALFSSYLKGLFVEIMHVRKVFLIASLVPSVIFISGIIFLENRVGKNDYKDDFKDKDEKKSLIVNEEAKDNNIGDHVVHTDNEKKLETDTSHLEKSIIVDGKDREHKEGLFVIEDFKGEHDEVKEEPINKGQMILDFCRFLANRFVYVPTLFLIVFMATPSYSDPFFYFLTNVLHFKATQLGKISFCSTLATLLSILFYRYYLKDTNFKTIIVLCSILAFFFNFLAYIVVTRRNVELGISDFWLCLASNSLLAGLGELILMPMLALACQLCPKNLEGTVYAFFMSALNFGGIMSGLNGSFLTSALGISSKNFDNFPKMILISNVVSLLPLFLLCCISDSYFHPELNKEKQESEPSEKEKAQAHVKHESSAEGKGETENGKLHG